MPSAGLCVRLLPLSPFFIIYFKLAAWYFSPSPSFFHTAFKGSSAPCSHTIDAISALIIPGGFFNRSLFIRASCPTHVLNFRMYLLFHHYMHRYDLSFGQAGLPGSCAYALRSR